MMILLLMTVQLLLVPEGSRSIVYTKGELLAIAPSLSLLSLLRGGSTTAASASTNPTTRTQTTTATTKKKKKKKKTSTTRSPERMGTNGNDHDGEKEESAVESENKRKPTTVRPVDGKRAMNQAMKETDAATALGDAIRSRANVLQKDVLPPHVLHPLQHSQHRLESSLTSLGRGLASSEDPQKDDDKEVSASATRSRLLAEYFTQTHGGVYAFQCLASLLAAACALASVCLAATTTDSHHLQLQWNLMRRAWLFGMIRHAGGLLAAASVSATALFQDKEGSAMERWNAVQSRLVDLAYNPVARQMFACCLLFGWTGMSTAPSATSWLSGITKDKVSQLPLKELQRLWKRAPTSMLSYPVDSTNRNDLQTALRSLIDLSSSTTVRLPWWMETTRTPVVVAILLAPLILREVVSNLGVLQTVLHILVRGKKPPPRAKGRRDTVLAWTCRGLESLTLLLLLTDFLHTGYRYVSTTSGASRPSLTTLGLQLWMLKVYLDFLLVVPPKGAEHHHKKKKKKIEI